MLDLTSRIARVPGLQTARISADELIILDENSEHYLGLDAAGVSIWDRVETPTSIVNLVDDLCCRYRGDRRTIEADVLAFVEQLIDENVVMTSD